MVNVFISGIMEFLRNIVTIFVNPLINAISNLPGGQSVSSFFSGVTTILYYIFEGGVFVKRFLMIPDGLFSSFFILLGGLTTCYFIVLGIQFIVRVYNLIKGPI